jgi:hypothetical protein
MVKTIYIIFFYILKLCYSFQIVLNDLYECQEIQIKNS